MVGLINFLSRIVSVMPHRYGVRNILVHSYLRRYYRVVCIALLYEIEINSIDATVVAGMKDVIAIVLLRVIGYPLQISVRSVSGEQALALTHDCMDD